VIPLKLQRREGLGFLASMNLGLDTGMVLALNIVDGNLLKPHKLNSFVRSEMLDQVSIE
jgi:hypothetical protein